MTFSGKQEAADYKTREGKKTKKNWGRGKTVDWALTDAQFVIYFR